MKDYKSALVQIDTALHEHDLSMVEWRRRFFAYQRQFAEFCILREVLNERIAFWTSTLTQIRKRLNKLEKQALTPG